MRKTFKKKFLAAFISAGLLVGTGSAIKADASESKYDDSNVSILTAVDNYVAANEYAFMDETEVKTEYVASNTVEEVKSPFVNEESSVESNPNVQGHVTEIVKDENAVVASEKESVTEETTENTTEENNETSTGESTSDVQVAVGMVDYTNKAIVSSEGTINIRTGASTDNNIVGTIGYAGGMDVVEKGDEWSLVSSGNCQGYIKNEYVSFGDEAVAFGESNLNKVAVITASSLSLREEANADSDCLTILPNGEKYRVVSVGDAWTKVEVDDTLSGYVSNEYIQFDFETTTAQVVESDDNDTSNDAENESNDNSEAETETEEATEESNDESEADDEEAASEDVPASPVGVDVVNFALGYVGCPYVYGGTSLTNGADCSGFVMRVYEHFGYQLPRTADIQATVGTPISLAALAPGDLLFYDHGSGSIQHVAIYIGDGQIVHASNSVTGIITSNAYYSTPCRAVRIIN